KDKDDKWEPVKLLLCALAESGGGEGNEEIPENVKCHVSSAFPKGLGYQEPDLLLKTSGALWEFQ
ncbi:9852_t:CDS:2, partial [Gigaspora rosea]